jgi:hypothetical protein
MYSFNNLITSHNNTRLRPERLHGTLWTRFANFINCLLFLVIVIKYVLILIKARQSGNCFKEKSTIWKPIISDKNVIFLVVCFVIMFLHSYIIFICLCDGDVTYLSHRAHLMRISLYDLSLETSCILNASSSAFISSDDKVSM